MKAALAAIVIGGVGGVASRQFANEPAATTQAAPSEPWRPTRNTIGTDRPMSAADLDRQQPSGGGAPSAPRVRQVGAVAATGANWSYRGCREARAAGATPLYRGQPGYGAHMDGDGDGIACEDYHAR
ncbi:excalibur calcium-binding domain-containing protein [Sphingobium sp. WCS2017Hpa-17]|uniref:excalibur calcium-binding domain-containing protein n=1 Tax=Sphingobium sp. WCS2017Hpa-17 TaxID=3073638 RepID=UPI00288C1BC2|nr:excalibur calcium-binding domain-containing protein [Sphingobium sp. WCS2017Hpa-17]